MIILGYTPHHHHHNNTVEEENLFVTNYLPLIAVNFIAVSYQFGLGPVGWSYTGNHHQEFQENFKKSTKTQNNMPMQW